MLRDSRPVFLNLLQIRLPVNALVSILHRITGVALIFSIPLVWAALARSLSGPEGYAQTLAALQHPLGGVILLLWLWFLLHHLFAGLRYLLLEFGIGETRLASLRTSWMALGAGGISTVIVWGGLWW